MESKVERGEEAESAKENNARFLDVQLAKDDSTNMLMQYKAATTQTNIQICLRLIFLTRLGTKSSGKCPGLLRFVSPAL